MAELRSHDGAVSYHAEHAAEARAALYRLIGVLADPDQQPHPSGHSGHNGHNGHSALGAEVAGEHRP